ncbi:hypothetical protein JCM1840_005347 [Sporobolomyces johnsonii]
MRHLSSLLLLCALFSCLLSLAIARSELSQSELFHDVLADSTPASAGVSQPATLENLHSLAQQVERELEQLPGQAVAGQVRVVRETMWIPVNTRQAAPDATPAVMVAVPAPNAVVKASEEAADVFKTIRKLRALRPIFSYALHHPIRFVYNHVLVPLTYFLLFVLRTFLQLVLYLLSSAASPFQVVFGAILSPFVVLLGFFYSLMPLWVAFGSAGVVGAVIGAVGGLLMGRTTHDIIAGAGATTYRALQWVGLASKPIASKKRGDGGTTAEEPAASDYAFGPGARIEARPLLFKSKSKSKGKQRAMYSDSEGTLTAGDVDDDLRSSRSSLGLSKSRTSAMSSSAFGSAKTSSSRLGGSEEEEEEEEYPDPSEQGLEQQSNGGRGRSHEKKVTMGSAWRGRKLTGTV